MKALSLLQPWGSLIATGAKRWETRSWQTRYRGPIAIHASKAWKQPQILAIAGSRRIWDHLVSKGFDWRPIASGPHNFPLSSIVALADLTDVIPTVDWMHRYSTSPFPYPTFEASELERVCGDYSVGRFAWQLENVRALKTPVPCNGALSLWEVPEPVWMAVEAQLP